VAPYGLITGGDEHFRRQLGVRSSGDQFVGLRHRIMHRPGGRQFITANSSDARRMKENDRHNKLFTVGA
jgi:hypothetical protein